MNILISNDDGINSVGLKSLVKAFSRLGDVYVVAPEGQRSSTSHHLTCEGMVKIEKREIEHAKEAYALWGTPADCAYLGLDFLYKDKIDLLVSGINVGLNVSTDIVYSGTIAAAREAYIHKIPSVAVSIDYSGNVNYDVAAEYGVLIAEKYFQDEKRNDYFLNINVPNLKKEEIKGIKVCDRVAVIHYDNNLSMVEKDGEKYIKIYDVQIEVSNDPDDIREDYTAVKKGYVAVTPLYNDHFSHEYMKHVEKML